ncbi:uncharacterized protein LOC123264332 [Cotesia glomerata]|uniref:uncharacterized protein LOC123264332 n=1 Tax=Cotesia glomerata TaxID=32391 RepID=UPI001D0353AC|nr:uncharacterized protein LOC123264332 [Cotesia glomerata]
MNYVIDFIGFYIDDRLRIEEFCECRVSKKGVEVRNPMLFAIDPDDVSSYGTSQNGNQEYYQKFGIGVASPRYLVSTLINYINELLSTNEKIFVRNHEKIQQLKDFMNMPYNYNNLMSLEAKGCDTSHIILGTDCQYHDNEYLNYCVRENAKFMANWLKEREFPGSIAVLDLSGYRTFNGSFEIKEISIMILNNYGSIINNILFVTVVTQVEDTSKEFVKAYNKTYYNNYGIKWKTGNVPLPLLSHKIVKLLINHDVTNIFVKNIDIEIKLSSLIKDNLKSEIHRLTDYGFIDQLTVNNRALDCKYHEHPNSQKNICVQQTNLQLVEFIIYIQLYKMEVLEGVEKFMQLSQQHLGVGNSSTSDLYFSNLPSNQIYTDSNVDSEITESENDEKDDRLKEFNLDVNTEILDDIDIDILLDGQDVKNDDFSMINFDIDQL